MKNIITDAVNQEIIIETDGPILDITVPADEDGARACFDKYTLMVFIKMLQIALKEMK